MQFKFAVHSDSLSEKSPSKLWAIIWPPVLSNGHLDVSSYSSCDWLNSKAVQRLIHKETGTADFNLSGDINIVGMRVW